MKYDMKCSSKRCIKYCLFFFPTSLLRLSKKFLASLYFRFSQNIPKSFVKITVYYNSVQCVDTFLTVLNKILNRFTWKEKKKKQQKEARIHEKSLRKCVFLSVHGYGIYGTHTFHLGCNFHI